MYSVGHRFIYFLIIYNAVFGIAYYCTGVGFTKIILRKKFLKFLKINSKFLRTSFFFLDRLWCDCMVVLATSLCTIFIVTGVTQDTRQS